MIDSTHHNPNPVIYIPLISPTELILWLLAMWLCVMQISWLVSKPWSIMLNFTFMLLSNAQKLPIYIMLNIMSITILQLCPHAQFVYDFIILMPTLYIRIIRLQINFYLL